MRDIFGFERARKKKKEKKSLLPCFLPKTHLFCVRVIFFGKEFFSLFRRRKRPASRFVVVFAHARLVQTPFPRFAQRLFFVDSRVRARVFALLEKIVAHRKGSFFSFFSGSDDEIGRRRNGERGDQSLFERHVVFFVVLSSSQRTRARENKERRTTRLVFGPPRFLFFSFLCRMREGKPNERTIETKNKKKCRLITFIYNSMQIYYQEGKSGKATDSFNLT